MKWNYAYHKAHHSAILTNSHLLAILTIFFLQDFHSSLYLRLYDERPVLFPSEEEDEEKGAVIILILYVN